MSYHQMGVANREIVERLMLHLTKSFEDFAAKLLTEYPEGLYYIDALMGCHNFYKGIILDLEQRTEGGEEVRKGLIRRIAIDTMVQALEKP